jgi:hypothetical protein
MLKAAVQTVQMGCGMRRRPDESSNKDADVRQLITDSSTATTYTVHGAFAFSYASDWLKVFVGQKDMEVLMELRRDVLIVLGVDVTISGVLATTLLLRTFLTICAKIYLHRTLNPPRLA